MSEEKPLILVCDDNEDARYALEKIVQHNGYRVVSVDNARLAIERARELKPALIFLDLMMPGMDGFEASKIIRSDSELRFTPVILVTARDSVDDVIQGLDAGADDYISKPFRSDELLARLRAALRLRTIYSQLERSEGERELLMRELRGDRKMVGASPAFIRVQEIINRVAKSDAPVLITGESGTGKELAARSVHDLSKRSDRPFIARNCAAFSEHLLESELFGHVKGAFTSAIKDQKGIFEAADGGTLFLDEIGEMPLALQPKLLRVLQEGTLTAVGSTQEKRVDVRIVAATNRDLQKMVQERTFREDLFYRLNVVTVQLPPLRERKDDIPGLIDTFLAQSSKRYAVSKKNLGADTERALLDYNWPGNIRELQNEIERLLILSGDEVVIPLTHLSDRILRAQTGDLHEGVETASREGAGYHEAIAALERKLILDALTRSEWNRSDAARTLGISRSNLLAKIQQFNLTPDGVSAS